MRWKNRLIKLYIDVPPSVPSDEELALDIADILDDNKWTMVVDPKQEGEKATINKVVIGEIEIEPEE